MTADHGQDRWATWLAQRRQGGDDPVLRLQAERGLVPVRDEVIANAALRPGQRVLDVGCGEGLIGFAAAAVVGPSGKVILSDLSSDLLERCRAIADQAGLADRCQFVQAPASDLSVIEDASLDAVVLRSVLIYEADKKAAFEEFYRVLRPGGRLSIFEPINRFNLGWRADRFLGGYDASPVADLAEKVRAIYDAIQPPDSDPMLDFDERDLLRLAEETGFEELHLRLHCDSEPAVPRLWQQFLNSSGNPRIPTLAEAMEQALTPAEADRLAAHVRPLVEQGRGQRRFAVAYLWAVRSLPGPMTYGQA